MIKAIISDADGTLVNTMYLIRRGQYEVAVEYLQEQGIPTHDIPEFEVYENYINKSVGGSTRETLEKTLRLLYEKSHQDHLKKVNYDDLNKRLDAVQDRIAPLYVHPFHGLADFFSWAGKKDVGVGIFTSGDRRMIIRNFGVCLPALGYTELFTQDDIPVAQRFTSFIARMKAVYGIDTLAAATCEDVTQTKPDPEGILKLLDELQVKPDEVIVLGDHSVDMHAAHKAGLHAIGITHGFGTMNELLKAGAIQVVKDLSSLTKLIDSHNSGKNILF
jgi:phosphoglycolate phosphatase-like HAD superfamily hydrolase